MLEIDTSITLDIILFSNHSNNRSFERIFRVMILPLYFFKKSIAFDNSFVFILLHFLLIDLRTEYQQLPSFGATEAFSTMDESELPTPVK